MDKSSSISYFDYFCNFHYFCQSLFSPSREGYHSCSMACVRAALRLRLDSLSRQRSIWYLNTCGPRWLLRSSTHGRSNPSIRSFAVKISKPKTNSKTRQSQGPQPSLLPVKGNQSPIPTRYESFAQSLAGRSSSTLLYQAPAFTSFNLFCYLTATFCFAYGAINLRK